MRKIKYNIFLALTLVLPVVNTACSDDDSPSLNKSIVGEASDFTDPRDGHVYKCVKIGDQIWMAENLAYYPERGSIDGCFTWNEGALSLNNVEIPSSDWADIYLGVLNDPANDWSVLEPSMRKTTLVAYGTMVQKGTWTPERVLSMALVKNCTTFIAMLNAKLDEEKPKYAGPAAKAHMEDQEAINGKYSEKYGFLYSLDAARAAVPEGWRLPTDEDWKKLEKALGMPGGEIDLLDKWRGNGCGTFLKEGGSSLFEAKMAGCNAWSGSGSQYIKQLESAYFWTNEEWVKTEESDGEMGTESVEVRYSIVRQLALYSNSIWRGTTRVENPYRPVLYSVRCVKDN